MLLSDAKIRKLIFIYMEEKIINEIYFCLNACR